MANLSGMQGTPWHPEFLPSDGNRRHPAHCKHHEGSGKKRICKNKKCVKYLMNCKTAKCDLYEEQTFSSKEGKK